MNHEFLDELHNIERFFNRLTVERVSFVKAMNLIGLVLKGTQMGKVFAIKYKDGALTVRASASLYTEIEINIIDKGDAEDFEVVCAYADTTNLLNNDPILDMVISSEYVTVESSGSHISYRTSIASVTQLERDLSKEMDVDVLTLTAGLKRLTGMTTVLKAFPSYSVISLTGDIMQMRTPNIWLEVKSSGLDMTMDVAIAKVIKAYTDATSGRISMHESLNYITIQSGSASLIIPKQDMASIEPLNIVTESYMFSGKVSMPSDLNKVKDLVRVAGSNDAMVHLAEGGIRVVSETNEHRVDLVVGNVDVHITSFTMRIEFLLQVLLLIGNTFTVKELGGLIYLQGPSNGAIISTI